MNEVIDALLIQVQVKLEENIPIQAREVLETIELELIDMSHKTWTIEDLEELNSKTDSMSKQLQKLKETENV